MPINTTIKPYASTRPEKEVKFNLKDEEYHPIFNLIVLELLETEQEIEEYLANNLYLYLLWSCYLSDDLRLHAVLTEAFLPYVQLPKWKVRRVIEHVAELGAMERNLAVKDRCGYLMRIVDSIGADKWRELSDRKIQ